MEHVSVSSSNIESVAHDPSLHILEVKFKSGGKYQYFGISTDKYKELLEAKSIGSHFNNHIKDKHECKKL